MIGMLNIQDELKLRLNLTDTGENNLRELKNGGCQKYNKKIVAK